MKINWEKINQYNIRTKNRFIDSLKLDNEIDNYIKNVNYIRNKTNTRNTGYKIISTDNFNIYTNNEYLDHYEYNYKNNNDLILNNLNQQKKILVNILDVLSYETEYPNFYFNNELNILIDNNNFDNLNVGNISTSSSNVIEIKIYFLFENNNDFSVEINENEFNLKYYRYDLCRFERNKVYQSDENNTIISNNIRHIETETLEIENYSTEDYKLIENFNIQNNFNFNSKFLLSKSVFQRGINTTNKIIDFNGERHIGYIFNRRNNQENNNVTFNNEDDNYTILIDENVNNNNSFTITNLQNFVKFEIISKNFQPINIENIIEYDKNNFYISSNNIKTKIKEFKFPLEENNIYYKKTQEQIDFFHTFKQTYNLIDADKEEVILNLNFFQIPIQRNLTIISQSKAIIFQNKV